MWKQVTLITWVKYLPRGRIVRIPAAFSGGGSYSGDDLEQVGAGGRVDYLKHGTQIWTHKPARISPVDRKEPIYLRSGRVLRAALIHSLLRGHTFAMSAGIHSILNEKEVMPGFRVEMYTATFRTLS